MPAFVPPGGVPLRYAPTDGTPILAWCVHSEDPYHLDGIRRHLTSYAIHCELLERHVNDGFHIVQWGGAGEESDQYGVITSWPDWWFLVDTNYEKPANPVRAWPLPGYPWAGVPLRYRLRTRWW